MVVTVRKAQNDPSYLEYVSPYIKNKNVRYSLYAAGSLAVTAAALRYGNTQVGITLAFAGCFAQGYQFVKLAREIISTATDKDPNNGKISLITSRFFTMDLIWGIAMNGVNLSLLYQESSLLLQAANLYSLKVPSLIFHATNLACLGCFSIPSAMDFIFQGDGLFSESEHDAEQIDSFPYTDMLYASHLWFYLFFYGVFRAPSPRTTMIVNGMKDFYEMPNKEVSIKMFFEWISSLSNPKPNKLFPRVSPWAKKQNSSDWERTEYLANHVFFHTLNSSLIAARLYCHPFPTAIFFGLGLFCPTNFQNEKTIRRSWEVVPDFTGMPINTKCLYLFNRLSSAEGALEWWNIPGACLNGLYLAEDFHFYRRRFCQ